MESFGSPIPDGWYTNENVGGQFLEGGGDVVDDEENNNIPKPRIYGVTIQKMGNGKVETNLLVWFKVENGRMSFCDSNGNLIVVKDSLLQNYPISTESL